MTNDRPPAAPLLALLPAAVVALVMLGVMLGGTAFVAWRVFQLLCHWTGGVS